MYCTSFFIFFIYRKACISSHCCMTLCWSIAWNQITRFVFGMWIRDTHNLPITGLIFHLLLLLSQSIEPRGSGEGDAVVNPLRWRHTGLEWRRLLYLSCVCPSVLRCCRLLNPGYNFTQVATWAEESHRHHRYKDRSVPLFIEKQLRYFLKSFTQLVVQC